MPGTLLRLTNVSLIDLYQARHSMGLMVNDFLQKAMPPSECRINADADFCRRLVDGQAALHALGIGLELLFVPRP